MRMIRGACNLVTLKVVRQSDFHRRQNEQQLHQCVQPLDQRINNGWVTGRDSPARRRRRRRRRRRLTPPTSTLDLTATAAAGNPNDELCFIHLDSSLRREKPASDSAVSHMQIWLALRSIASPSAVCTVAGVGRKPPDRRRTIQCSAVNQLGFRSALFYIRADRRGRQANQSVMSSDVHSSRQ